MKKTLLYFDSLCNKIKNSLISEEDAKANANVQVTVTDDEGNEIPAQVQSSTTTDITEQDINVNIDKVDVNINIKNLKIKLNDKLNDIKKKLYASRLYAQNVGNTDALKDYGYFLGQKELLYSILKQLNTIIPELTQDEE